LVICKRGKYYKFNLQIIFLIFELFTNHDKRCASTDDILDRYKKIGFGLNFGAGMHFVKENSFNMFFEALYSPDCFNSFDDNEYKIKNTGFEFKVGIGF
jgi:hypothetical protein